VFRDFAILEIVVILSALLQKKSNNTAKIMMGDNFTKPVADATGYNNITPIGV